MRMESNAKRTITLGLAFIGLLILSPPAMAVGGEGSEDVELTWDTEAEAIVAEARAMTLRRAAPEPLDQEGGSGGGPPEGGPPEDAVLEHACRGAETMTNPTDDLMVIGLFDTRQEAL